MINSKILKQVLKNLGNIAVETGKETIGHAGKITESIITGKELLGDIKPLTDQDMSSKRAEDEQKKQKEISDLRSQMSERGRDVGGEIKQVEREIVQTEEEKERLFLDNIRRQREAEVAERDRLSTEMGVSGNPSKRKKKLGGAFVQGKKKTQQPDPSQLSQTAEIAGKMK